MGRAGNLLVALTAAAGVLASGAFGQPDIAKSAVPVIRLGHSSEVQALTFSPDGRWLASGSRDHTARVWDVRTGEVRASLFGHGHAVRSVLFSRGGDTLVTAGDDGTVRLWGALTGRPRATLHGFLAYDPDSRPVAVSPDGKWVATGSEELAGIWDLQTGKLVHQLSGHESSIQALSFSPDGRTLATAGGNIYIQDGKPVPVGEVRLWDARTGKFRGSLVGHTQPVKAVAFTPDGARLATAGGQSGIQQRANAGEVRLWDPRTRRLVAAPVVQGGGITQLAFSPNGKTLAGGGEDGVVRLWSARDGRALKVLRSGNDPVQFLEFSRDGDLLAAAGVNLGLRLWDLRTGRLRITRSDQHVSGPVAFSPDGRLLATGAGPSTLLWDLKVGRRIRTFPGYRMDARGVAFSDDEPLLAQGTSSGAVRFWDLRQGRPWFSLEPVEGLIERLALSPDGKTLAVYNRQSVELWDVTTRSRRSRLEGELTQVSAMLFSPDGRWLAAGGSWVDGNTNTEHAEARVWETATGKLLGNLPVGRGGLRVIRFSPDTRRMATAGYHGDVSLWALPASPSAETTARLQSTLVGHGYGVTDLAFSPDGTLATLDYPRQLRFWEAATGKPVERALKSLPGARHIGFIAGGNSIAALEGERVRLWNVRTGQEETLRSSSQLAGLPAEIRRPLGGSSTALTVLDPGSGEVRARILSVPPEALGAGKDAFRDGGWICITPEGYFDASPEAARLIHWNVAGRVLPSQALRERFYSPQKVTEALSAEPRPFRRPPPGLPVPEGFWTPF